jgi:hypothetical protein
MNNINNEKNIIICLSFGRIHIDTSKYNVFISEGKCKFCKENVSLIHIMNNGFKKAVIKINENTFIDHDIYCVGHRKEKKHDNSKEYKTK